MRSSTTASRLRAALLVAAAALGPTGLRPTPAQDAPAPAGAVDPLRDLKAAHPEIVDARPSTDRAPYDPTITGRTITFWEAEARRAPEPYIPQRELAGAYLARQRETGDIADAVRAEGAARESLRIMTRNNAAASIRLAQAMLAQHRFPEALAVAQAAAKQDSKAERIVVDILLELGDYAAATRGLQAIPTEPDDMNLLALRARFAQIQGRPEEALQLLRAAAAIIDLRPDMPAEVAAWCHTMVGHHLIDAGQLADGETACQKALTIFPNDYRAMTGMAEAAAWRGDHAGALKWATAAIRIAPQNPEALRLQAEAAAGLGRTAEAAAHFQALRDLAHSFPRIYDQHWAVFCLDTDQNLDDALVLARKDLELRHDVHAHDTLAYACFKKGLLDEADREMTLALAQGTQEAPLMHHAALIARARGDHARAESMTAAAKRLNPYLIKDEPARP